MGAKSNGKSGSSMLSIFTKCFYFVAKLRFFSSKENSESNLNVYLKNYFLMSFLN
tara:strand:- start:1281 stop:1445 length:165 start_codon:yes stop_codon:yes gene_type:complete